MARTFAQDKSTRKKAHSAFISLRDRYQYLDQEYIPHKHTMSAKYGVAVLSNALCMTAIESSNVCVTLQNSRNVRITSCMKY